MMLPRIHCLILSMSLVCGCSRHGEQPRQVDAPLDLSSVRYETEVVRRDDTRVWYMQKIELTPSHGIRFAKGLLLAVKSREKYRGELVFRDKDGVDHRLLESDVEEILAHPSGAYVFADDSHLDSYGVIYDVATPGPQDIPSPELIHRLVGHPVKVLRRPGNAFEIKVADVEMQPDDSTKAVMRCYLFGADTSLIEQPCSQDMLASPVDFSSLPIRDPKCPVCPPPPPPRPIEAMVDSPVSRP